MKKKRKINKLPREKSVVLLNSGKRSKNIIVWLIFGTIGIFTIPDFTTLPTIGLDNSWNIGLNMAIANKLQFGKEIIFTFGPLGFLWWPVQCYFNLWAISSAATVFIHFLLIYLIVLMMTKLSATAKEYVLIGIILMLTMGKVAIDYKLSFSTSILLYLAMTNQFGSKRSLFFALISASLLMAVASSVKFTGVLTSVSTLFIVIPFYIYKKQIRYCFYIVLGYIISVLFLWTACGQEIINIPAYILNSSEITSGYSATMQRWDNQSFVYLGFFVIGSLIFLLSYSILKRKLNSSLFLLLTLGFVAMSCKHGFVRSDGHIYIFYANTLLVIGFVLFISNKDTIKLPLRWLLPVFISAGILLVVTCKGYSATIIPDISRNISLFHSAAVKNNPVWNLQTIKQAKNKICRDYPLNEEILKYIDNKTVDVFPTQISMAYAYNMNWFPRPIFQSYSAYTSKLDLLNAQHFNGSDAPEVLFYEVGSIDKRYPLFDEPATFRTVLRNYKPVFVAGRDIILEKKKEQYDSSMERSILITDTEIGKAIPVPKTNGYLFARIHTEYSVLGEIVKLLYKLPEIQINIISSNKVYGYRFISSTAENGVFLSSHVKDWRGLLDVFLGNLNRNIDGFVITAEKEYFYKKHITVEFFEIPRENIKTDNNNENNIKHKTDEIP
jgi:hypothetical protein